MRETKKSLQARWDTDSGRRLAAEILRLSALGKAESIHRIAGTVDGKLDLRGLKTRAFYEGNLDFEMPTEVPGPSREIEFNNAAFNNATFEYSELYGVMFDGCHFSDSSFKRTKIRSARSFATEYENVDFTAMDSGDLALGSFRGSKRTAYRDCDFSDAKLRRSSSYVTLFERCRFQRTLVKDTHFWGSVLSDCEFSGHLEDVLFYGPISSVSRTNPPPRTLIEDNPLRNVDFSKCSVSGLDFKTDVDLSTVRLPSETEHLFVWHPRRTYSRVLEAVKGEPWGDFRANKGMGMSVKEFLQLLVDQETRIPETLLEIHNRKMWLDDAEGEFGRMWGLVERYSQPERPPGLSGGLR